MTRLRIILQSKTFLLFSFLFLLVYLFVWIKVIPVSSYYKEGVTELVGTVLDYHIDGDALKFTIKAKEKVQATYYFDSLKEKEYYETYLQLGVRVKLKGELILPSDNTIPNTFNYNHYLLSKKIHFLFQANELEILACTNNPLYKIKNMVINRIKKNDNTSPYLFAFLLGDTSNFSEDIYQYYRNNGVTHLFAVSGMHLNFFLLIIPNFLKKLGFRENMCFLFLLLFLAFYLFLVGFTPSLARASLFSILIFCNQKFQWKMKSLVLLYYLFFFFLLIHPFYLYDLGFLYSFTTSYGLLLFHKKITGNYFFKLIKTSFIAFLFSLPITLSSFYEFNLLTVFNNILIVPFVSLLLFPLSIFTFLLPFLNSFLSLGFTFLEWLNEILSHLAILIVVPKISICFISIYYLILYLYFKISKKYFLLFIPLFLLHYGVNLIDPHSSIYYLDVGQGDSTLIITEQKKDIILIDSGGKIPYEKEEWQKRKKESSVSNTIIQFLHSLGITKIDLFIATHGDIDHIGYASSLFQTIKVKQVMLNHNDNNKQEQELFNHFPNFKGDVYYGKKIYLQNLNHLVSQDENESSLVLYANISHFSFLFMGDASTLAEKEILDKYNLPNIDVLKVGHHGSRTSSSKEFINTINPKFSIISVGKNNRYGHPNKEILDNLNNSKIYRTDKDGSIEIKLNQKGYKINTYSP